MKWMSRALIGGCVVAGVVLWGASADAASSRKVAVQVKGLDGATITFQKKVKDIMDMSSRPRAQKTFNLPVTAEFQPNYIEADERKAAKKGVEYSPRRPYLFRIDVNDANGTVMFGELIVYRVTKFAEHSIVDIELSAEDHVNQVAAGRVVVLRFTDPSATSTRTLQTWAADPTGEPEALDAVTAMGRPKENEVCRLVLGNRPNVKRR